MRYYAKAHLEHGEQKRDLPVAVDIADYNGNRYGNGKMLALTIGASDWTSFDIRYDKRYNPADEKGYIERFLRDDVWGGGDASWHLIDLEWQEE